MGDAYMQETGFEEFVPPTAKDLATVKNPVREFYIATHKDLEAAEAALRSDPVEMYWTNNNISI